MNQEREDFEQLRRLLKLKRYEQPPPRYFNDFSSQVIARIRKGERGEETTPAVAWYTRLMSVFQARPAYSGIFGAAICAVLIGVADGMGKGSEQSALAGGAKDASGSAGSFASKDSGPTNLFGGPLTGPTLFDHIGGPRTAPVGYPTFR